MPQPFFSIVVPTWNRSALIEETLHSLLDQDFPRSGYEIIIVDDGSTDDTVERLQPYVGRIRILRQEKSGIAAARNLGLRQARGRYLVPFDSDDILFPFALGVYRQAIESFQHPPVVISSSCGFLSGQDSVLDPPEPTGITCVRCRDYFGKSIQTGASNVTFVLRMDVVLGTGGYAQDSYEDNDLICRMGTAGPLVKILSPRTVAVRHHDGNTTRNLDPIRRGLVGIIRNERHGIYPGGWRRMLDRRGLIGLETLSCLYYCYIKGKNLTFSQRLGQIAGILLQARGMVLAAPLRKLLNRFYPREARTMDYASGRDAPAPANRASASPEQ